jgi:DNA-binding response OmpR family regulator
VALTALILAPEPLDDELGTTALWRKNVERYPVTSIREARTVAEGGRPDIVVVDERIPDAVRVIGQLRLEPPTRGVSIVVLARGDFDTSELGLLEAGANAILRLPPGPDWDDRLERLLHVPLRRATRFAVHVQNDSALEVAGQIVPATAVNLSVNGMLVESAHTFGIGDDVQFAFHLPEIGGVVAGSGTVVRHTGSPGQFGLELTHVEGDGRVRIKQFVEGPRGV